MKNRKGELTKDEFDKLLKRASEIRDVYTDKTLLFVIYYPKNNKIGFKDKHDGEIVLGELYLGIDWQWYFNPHSAKYRAWAGWVLEKIVEKIKELNGQKNENK